MMITRQDLVNEAMTWIGTPFHHQGRLKHVGVDCVGVIVGTCKNLGIPVDDVENYPHFPIHGIFNNAVNYQTVPVDLADVLPGDLMKFKWTNEPQHLAIVVSIDPIKIVHAYGSVNACILSEFDSMWRGCFTDARRLKVFA